MEARALDLLPGPEADPEDFYHPHEEYRVPVSGTHDALTLYLESALTVALSERWVAADLCCYWIRGNNRVYLGPDVFVAGCPPPDPLPSSFRLWEHGPLLLVIEVGSRTSLRRDVGPKLDRYAEGLLPEEYLDDDADHRLLGMHRRGGDGYAAVEPDAAGRLWSASTGFGFGMEASGFLRAFDAQGQPLPTLQEAAELRRAAEERAASEAELRREAEQFAESEAERRRSAEEQARSEAALRRQAEDRAADAVRERDLQAERLAALEAELARLRKPD